jgi:hypothetical protein
MVNAAAECADWTRASITDVHQIGQTFPVCAIACAPLDFPFGVRS